MPASSPGRTVSGAVKDIEYYARALRAPRVADGYRSLGDRAREAGWSHEEYLAAVLSREVAEREASGAALRIRAARFPGHKLLEECNFDHQPAADRNLVAHLGTGVFLEEAKNVVLLGRLAPGSPIWPSGSGSGPHAPVIASCSTPRPGGYRDWPKLTTAAACPGTAKLRRYKLLIVDEVGYIPFDQDSANLFFQLVSSRYEHASLVLTSNLAFSRWGEVFSDATVASAMIDRIVPYAEVLNLTGSSYRLRNKTRTQLQAQ